MKKKSLIYGLAINLDHFLKCRSIPYLWMIKNTPFRSKGEAGWPTAYSPSLWRAPPPIDPPTPIPGNIIEIFF